MSNALRTQAVSRFVISSRTTLVASSVCVVFLCSCSTDREPLAKGPISTEVVTELPSECSAHESFRHGLPIALKLRIGHETDALFLVDTGCSKTTLDASFEPSLGPCLRKEWVVNLEGGTKRQKVFAAPKLYLGNARLFPGETVLTGKVCGPDNCPYNGILGMDCLSKYCIQMDFEQGKVRFLAPQRLQPETLGTKFPIAPGYYVPVIDMSLPGIGSCRFILDSGFWDPIDATLRPARMRVAAESKMVTPTSLFIGFRVFSCEPIVIGSESYKDLLFGEVPVGGKEIDGFIGFRFLARHVATFDFPNRVLYLKRKTSGSARPGQ